MLAATDRLRRRDEFSATVAGGRRAARGAVVVHAASRPPVAVEPIAADGPDVRREQLSETVRSTSNPARTLTKPSVRAGFVVSKAVGGAVVRNRVRRRLRHLMRSRLDRLPDRTDVVVRALPGAANRTYAALGADLDGALSTIVKDHIRPARPRRRGRS